MSLNELILIIIVLATACTIFYAIETWHDVDVTGDCDECETKDYDGDPSVPNKKD